MATPKPAAKRRPTADERRAARARKETEGDAPQLRFRFRGKEYPIVSFEDLTYGEVEMIEDAFDKPISDIDARRAKVQRWMIYTSIRRAGEEVEFDDLGTVSFNEIGATDDDAEGPTLDAPDADA